MLSPGRHPTYDAAMTTPKGGTSVSCPCGASLEIDPNETTQELSCPECGQILEVAIAIDSRTNQVRLGILVKDQAVAPRQTKGKGQEIHTAKCTCGAQITIEPGGMDSFYSCGACGADYTATFKKPKSGGVSTLVLRPVIASPMSRTTKRVNKFSSVPPAPPKSTKVVPAPPKVFQKAPAPPPAPNPAAIAAKEKFLLMSKGDIGAQEIEGGGVDCFCGGRLALKEGFNREILKCPKCATGYRVFQAAHPRTGVRMAVMIPRD